jgi:hypothetical protein
MLTEDNKTDTELATIHGTYLKEFHEHIHTES